MYMYAIIVYASAVSACDIYIYTNNDYTRVGSRRRRTRSTSGFGDSSFYLQIYSVFEISADFVG